MKQIVLNIPDNEYSFILTLLKKFSFIEFITPNAKQADYNISEEQKNVVRERIKKYEANTGDIIEWEDIEKKIKID